MRSTWVMTLKTSVFIMITFAVGVISTPCRAQPTRGATSAAESTGANAQSAECVELVKLYQSALSQYKEAAQRYLKYGCQESSSTHPTCRALESAAREMKATVEMFTMRGRALKCRADVTQALPQDACARLQSLVDRSRDKLNTLREQRALQRCDRRRRSSACRALERAMKQPREVEKAAMRRAAQDNCTLR